MLPASSVSREPIHTRAHLQPDQTAQLASALLETHRSSFGALDTRGLANAVVELSQSNPASTGALLQALAPSLSPVEQGGLQRDIGDIIDAIAKAIQKVIDTIAGIAGSLPTPPAQTLPPTAAGSATVPGLADIARDPVVTAAVNQAWLVSNPNTTGAKQETGFWVLRDDKTGQLSIVQFPSNGTRDSLTPGAPPAVDGKSVVAFFHTHPNTSAEGYVQGPSPADQNFAAATGVPGIIRSHDGMYYFN